MSYTFNKYVVADFEEEMLKASPKLFSKALLAAYYMNKSKDNLNHRLIFKENLLKEISLLKDVGQIEINAVFYFVDYLLVLPDELSEQLRQEILTFIQREELEMLHFRDEEISPTLAAIMEMKRKDGIEEGIEQGLEQGMEKGIEQGKLLAKKETAIQLLKLSMPIVQIAEATALSVDEINMLKLEQDV